MGQSTSSPIQYGVFIGEEKPGETRVLRHVEIGDKPLREVNSFGVETIWDCFEKVAKSSRATANCLGTREKHKNKAYFEFRELKSSNCKYER